MSTLDKAFIRAYSKGLKPRSEPATKPTAEPTPQERLEPTRTASAAAAPIPAHDPQAELAASGLYAEGAMYRIDAPHVESPRYEFPPAEMQTLPPEPAFGAAYQGPLPLQSTPFLAAASVPVESYHPVPAVQPAAVAHESWQPNAVPRSVEPVGSAAPAAVAPTTPAAPQSVREAEQPEPVSPPAPSPTVAQMPAAPPATPTTTSAPTAAATPAASGAAETAAAPPEKIETPQVAAPPIETAASEDAPVLLDNTKQILQSAASLRLPKVFESPSMLKALVQPNETAKQADKPVKSSEPVAAAAEFDPAAETDEDEPAQTNIRLPETAPAAPIQSPKKPFAAEWEVDQFVWPDVCSKLLKAEAKYFEHVGQRLRESTDGQRQVLMVSGCRRGEGRTTLALCLARCAADAGINVALFDADLQNPQLGLQLGVETPCGWLDAVQGNSPLKEAAIASIDDRITLFPLSGEDADGIEADDERLIDLMADVSSRFDLVVVDAGPVGDESIGSFGDEDRCPIHAAIVVRDLRSTTEKKAVATAEKLQRCGVQAVGIAENFRSAE